ncbi:MAG: peptidoglycan-binding protein [Rhizobium sp.]|nr:peptidoglycan-binding protein [Rhizobium sp.]
MTKPKRKSPEKKEPAAQRASGLLLKGASALGRLVARHPRPVGGLAAFSVAFGFIAANALWYQPGQHPSPIFSTRDTSDFNALAGVNRNARLIPDPASVTTFKIERETAADANAAPAADVSGAAVATADPANPALQAATDADFAENAALVISVQGELARRGLYDGVADGVIGPRTEAAIAVFQRSVGVEANGLVSPELLAALKTDRSVTAAVPKSRPTEDIDAAVVDPVAAAIRSASTPVVTAPTKPQAPRDAAGAARPTATPPAAMPVSLSGTAADAALIMEIQRGLANIAYTDVSVDGVAGDQTRAAIRRFQRHYRLPETGEPSEIVLKKLRDIGAL